MTTPVVRHFDAGQLSPAAFQRGYVSAGHQPASGYAGQQPHIPPNTPVHRDSDVAPTGLIGPTTTVDGTRVGPRAAASGRFGPDAVPTAAIHIAGQPSVPESIHPEPVPTGFRRSPLSALDYATPEEILSHRLDAATPAGAPHVAVPVNPDPVRPASHIAADNATEAMRERGQ